MADSLTSAVLIVGAGPTGLTLANALCAYGVPVHIVDQKSAASDDSKGVAINLATQYGLALIGLGQVLGQTGCRVKRLNLLWQGRRLNPIDFRRLAGRHQDCATGDTFQTFITQPQAQTERELLAALASQACDVAWDTRLQAVQVDGDSAQVQLQEANGKLVQRHYPYVIGCEGKRSLVREAMQAQMSGNDYPMYFALGDFALDWGLPADQVYYHVYQESFFIIVPIGAGIWRVVVKHDGAPPATPLLATEITSVVQHYLGQQMSAAQTAKLFTKPPLWMSRASFYTRVVDRLQRGPLLLAGDAAHLFVPIGGTGMNTGIQDALNLAWKLAWCWHGLARPALLASYESERLAAINATAAATDLSLHLIARRLTQSAALDELVPTMKNRTALRQTLPLRYSGLALSYRLPSSTQAINPPVGQFCLALAGLRKLLPSASLPAALLAVAYLENPPQRAEHAALQQLIHLQQQHARVLGLLLVSSTARLHALQEALQAETAHLPVRAVSPALLQLSGLQVGQLMLLRPDGIIASCTPLTALQDVQNFFDHYFWPPIAKTAKAAKLPPYRQPQMEIQ